MDVWDKLPAPAKVCMLGYLGNDIVALNTAMCNREGRAVLLEVYTVLKLHGLAFTLESLPPWNDPEAVHTQDEICEGLKWALKRHIKVRNFKLSVKGQEQQDVLWLLIHRRRYGMARELISRCSDTYDLNASNKYGRTPLHTAVTSSTDDDGGLKIVELLCAQDSTDIECRDRVNRTPLMWAGITASPGALRLLLNAGAVMSKQDKNGETALHFAALGGSIEAAKELLERGAHVNVIDAHSHSPLDSAKGDASMIALLRHYKALSGAEIKERMRSEQEQEERAAAGTSV